MNPRAMPIIDPRPSESARSGLSARHGRTACRRLRFRCDTTGNDRRDDMKAQRPAGTPPWMLFAFPAVIAVPIIAGFLLGGPVVGFLVASLVAVVGVAIRMEPRIPRAAAQR